MNESVHVNGKYQVVIPKSIREKIDLKKGDELSLSLQEETIIMRIKPRSFSDYTLGLHNQLWKEINAKEYVKKEWSAWKISRQV